MKYRRIYEIKTEYPDCVKVYSSGFFATIGMAREAMKRRIIDQLQVYCGVTEDKARTVFRAECPGCGLRYRHDDFSVFLEVHTIGIPDNVSICVAPRGKRDRKKQEQPLKIGVE